MTTHASVRDDHTGRLRRQAVSGLAVVALAASFCAAAAPASAQSSAKDCFAADLTVERWANDRGVVVFTTDGDEESRAAAAGFFPTGDAFGASSTPARGLVALREAYKASSKDHSPVIWDGEWRGILSRGWEDRGTVGYVSPVPIAGCDDEVKLTRASRGAFHSVAVDAAEASAARSAGYRLEYSWYAEPAVSAHGEGEQPAPEPPTEPAPEPTTVPVPEPTTVPVPEPEPTTPAPTAGDGDGKFTVATYPDTQNEVFASAGTRFIDRSRWLVSQKDALDLRFVTHTGDVVNWDTDAHEQFALAEAALDPLEDAGIPYQLSIGNHDTMATGVGGSARDVSQTRALQRTTTTFNSYWSPSDYRALGGVFEEGKVDNTFSTFTAEGADWLVLNLELWPRIAVVDWAEGVIATHPDANVIIQTHSFLNDAADIDGAGISKKRWIYGDASPQYVFDRLVAPYSNVKVVMSGHTGGAVSKVITTPAGNNVAFLLQALHSMTNNPVRLSQFDVAAGTIDTRVYAPQDGATWDVNTLTGMSFIVD